VNPLHKPEFEQEQDCLDPELKKAARRAWAEVAAKVARAEITLNSQRIEESQGGFKYLENAYREVAMGIPFANYDEAELPAFYRELSKKQDDNKEYPFSNALKEVLENNLVLIRQGKELIESSDYDYYFLCAEIDDEDLPWDVNEIDW
jgi:hypothetical protein